MPFIHAMRTHTQVDTVRKAAAAALAQVMEVVVHVSAAPATAAAVASLCHDEDMLAGVAACLSDRLPEVTETLDCMVPTSLLHARVPYKSAKSGLYSNVRTVSRIRFSPLNCT